MDAKFLKVRNVKTPTRWTKISSWIDFYVPETIVSMMDSIRMTPITEENQKLLFDKCLWTDKNKIIIPPRMWLLIPSWLKVILPKKQVINKFWENEIVRWKTYEMVIYNKSWIAVKTNLLVWAQVIDNDYRWEFSLHLINCWNDDVVIDCWQKIAQWIIREVELCDINVIELQEFMWEVNTERWQWGFGSTWK